MGDTTAYTSLKNAIDCPDGGSGKHYVDLGSEVLPHSGPVTIELWCTLLKATKWSKALVIGNSNNDSIVLTFNKSSATGPMAFCVAGNGGDGDNKEFGTCPVGTECYVAVTMTPTDSGTTIVARLWNPTTRSLIGTMTYNTSWTINKLGQNNARLSTATFWGDADPHAAYNEFRVWNASFSEAQQRINMTLGPDKLPDLADASPSMLDVASGAVVDLVGGTVEQYGVKGTGKVQNGTLVVSGVLSPGGDGTMGTLKLDAGVKVKGTIRLDVGDVIECAGETDLTEATVIVADPENLRGQYTFLTSAGNGVKGPVTNSRLEGGRVVKVSPGRATIAYDNITIFIR